MADQDSELLRMMDGNPRENGPDHVKTFAAVLNSFSKTYSYRHDEALKNSPSNARAMLRDPYIRSLLNERILPTTTRDWQLEVDNPKDPNQKVVAEALTKVIKSIPRFTQLRRSLQWALWYGRAGSQGEWVREPVDGQPMWRFVNHHPVNGDKLQYRWDGTPGVMVQPSYSYPGAEIVYGDRAPILMLDRPELRRQFVIHRWELEDADYWEADMAGAIQGTGLRSQIYWAWWLRDECLGWAVDFMQKVGTMGLLIFWYEQGNKEARAKAEENAKSANTRAALVMPRSEGDGKTVNGVEQIAPSTGGIDALRGLIEEYFEGQMERLIVGQTLSSGTEGSGLGGTGVADMHADTKYQLLKYDAELLDETLTADLVEVAKELNFPWADFPVRFKSVVPDPTAEKKLETLLKVSEKLPVKADTIRELGGATKPEDGEETVGGAQPMGAEPMLGGLLGGGDSQEPDEPAVYTYAGRWITIGGQKGSDGKRKGGSKVYIEDGRITKGHPSLVGKKPSNIKGKDHDSRGVRKQLKDSREYAVAKVRKQARKAGHDVKALDDLAKDIADNHNAYVEDKLSLLKEAREYSKANGFGDLRNLKQRNARGQMDAASLRGFDEISEAMANRYPQFFTEGEPSDQLYEMLTGPTPERMSDEDAYEQALDYLEENKRTRDDDDEERLESTTAEGETIRFLPHPNMDPDEETTVMVDARSLDEAWQEDKFTIRPDGEGAIGGRLDNFRNWMKKGKPVEASRVSLDAEGVPVFVDGRHRMRVLSDMGIDKIAITVPKQQASDFRSRFGGGGSGGGYPSDWDDLIPMQANVSGWPYGHPESYARKLVRGKYQRTTNAKGKPAYQVGSQKIAEASIEWVEGEEDGTTKKTDDKPDGKKVKKAERHTVATTQKVMTSDELVKNGLLPEDWRKNNSYGIDDLIEHYKKRKSVKGDPVKQAEWDERQAVLSLKAKKGLAVWFEGSKIDNAGLLNLIQASANDSEMHIVGNTAWEYLMCNLTGLEFKPQRGVDGVGEKVSLNGKLVRRKAQGFKWSGGEDKAFVNWSHENPQLYGRMMLNITDYGKPNGVWFYGGVNDKTINSEGNGDGINEPAMVISMKQLEDSLRKDGGKSAGRKIRQYIGSLNKSKWRKVMQNGRAEIIDKKKEEAEQMAQKEAEKNPAYKKKLDTAADAKMLSRYMQLNPGKSEAEAREILGLAKQETN